MALTWRRLVARQTTRLRLSRSSFANVQTTSVCDHHQKHRLSSSPPPSRPLDAYLSLIRFNTPVGTHLLFLPSAWGLLLGSICTRSASLDPQVWLIFAIGSFLTRSGGVIVNDLTDRDIDGRVKRTANRPLASGKLSATSAVAVLGLFSTAALGLLLKLPPTSLYMGIAAVPLIIAYPRMKRITFWPQAFLGLCMNYGALMGFTAAAGSVTLPVILPLYAAGIAWTLHYDTIYGYQDRADDEKVNVKSTALLLGDRWGKPFLCGCSAVTIGGLYLAMQQAGALSAGTEISLIVASGHLSWQLVTVDLNNPESCGKIFRSNQWVGVAIVMGLASHWWWKRDDVVREKNDEHQPQDS